MTSVLFHLLLLGPFFIYSNFVLPLTYQKRGEPLLVDIAPERPEEKAPLGNPSRPVAPPDYSKLQHRLLEFVCSCQIDRSP